jgi:CHAT domain-containing protein
LTLGDVLSINPPPKRVVLSSCESAATSASTFAAAIGLAHAFVLAGSSEVLGAFQPLNDQRAAQLMGSIYNALSPGDSLETTLSKLTHHDELRLIVP